MTDSPGAAWRVASFALAGLGVLLFLTMVAQGRPGGGVEGLFALGASMMLAGAAFFFVFVGAIFGAMAASVAAAAGDRRGRTGLPLLVNVVALLSFVAFLLSLRP
jgi:hypothetical protein